MHWATAEYKDATAVGVEKVTVWDCGFLHRHEPSDPVAIKVFDLF